MKHFKQLFVFALLAFLGFGQMWAVDVKDEFTSSTFSATSTTYVGTTIQGTSTTSGTAYSAFTNLAGTGYFGIRGYNKTKGGTETYAGIISTTTNGNLKSVKVIINTATNTSNRKVYIYGKTTAYTAISDLFDNNKKGTLIEEITYQSGTTEYTATIPINSSYQYIGITTNNNLVALDKIEIIWSTGSGSPEPSVFWGPFFSLSVSQCQCSFLALFSAARCTLSNYFKLIDCSNQELSYSVPLQTSS